MCPNYNSMGSKWLETDGKGGVYSWIVVVQQVHPAFEIPYTTIIKLKEGVRATINTTINIIDCIPDEFYNRYAGLREIQRETRELSYKPTQGRRTP